MQERENGTEIALVGRAGGDDGGEERRGFRFLPLVGAGRDESLPWDGAQTKLVLQALKTPLFFGAFVTLEEFKYVGGRERGV